MECWSVGVLEYWIEKVEKIFIILLKPLLHYSNTPIGAKPLIYYWS